MDEAIGRYASLLVRWDPSTLFWLSLNATIGKGLHSTNKVAKLKPAIEELIQKSVFSIPHSVSY